MNDDFGAVDDIQMDEAESSHIEDNVEGSVADKKVGRIETLVLEKFKRSEDARYNDEERWLKAYHNFRGIYGPDVMFTETEKSQVFVKVSKTKALAAYGQVTEVLFGNSKFPLNVNRTTLPDGIQEAVHFEGDKQAAPAAPPQPGQPPMPPAAPTPAAKPDPSKLVYQDLLPHLQDKFKDVQDKIVEGVGLTPQSHTFHPADVAAKKMEKKIHDQLEESSASKHLRKTAFESVLFGTGVMKGPFAVDKEYPRWTEDGNYDPLIKTIPQCSSVSIWDSYPDPDADNMDEAEFFIERHKMSRSQLRALKRRPFFRNSELDMAIELGESYERKHWEEAMKDGENNSSVERFEVLEFWGYLDTDVLEEYEVDIPDNLKDVEQVSVNVWVCNERVIRLVMNPFNPTHLPYYAVPYEVNPYSFFGIGLVENMDDTQTLMNGFMRMSVDNAALSGNLLVEIDESALVPGQDLKVHPGKVFVRQAGAPGQAIFGTKFPNVSNENMQMFDKARVLADESTGLPSFAHGQTGVQGVGRTASGISMLMSAANGSIRTVIKNFDDYLLGPLGKAFFNFNMQFDFDPEIKGDLEVKAQGTASLMANEVRSQRLMQFLGIVQNPAVAPFAKMDYIIREIAESMELDPDKVANNMAEAELAAEILKKMQGIMPAQGAEGAPAGTTVGDTQGSGGGTIGTGSVPTPGEQGFSANTGEG